MSKKTWRYKTEEQKRPVDMEKETYRYEKRHTHMKRDLEILKRDEQKRSTDIEKETCTYEKRHTRMKRDLNN